MKFTTTNRSLRSARLGNRNRGGAVAAEFALVAPLVFTLFFGCYELARANLMQHAAESAAYEGARVGIIPGAEPGEVRAAAESVLTSVGVKVFDVEVSPGTITRETEKITVQIKVPFTETSFDGQCTLNRETL